MGKVTGFLEYPRENYTERPVEERLQDYREIPQRYPHNKLQIQGARCMDCGIPFCHSGCPLGNLIPEWNDLLYQGKWQEAFERLCYTNNFPEITGRVCPAPCETACVLGLIDPAVNIKLIELGLVERAYEEGWIEPQPPGFRTGKTVAVVGSGPAGLAAADQLNKVGHTVTVFERADQIGGLLVYGIPDFKLDKAVLRRRLEIMEQEGVSFRTGVCVGKDLPAERLLEDYDAVVLTGGATRPRDLPIPGRELDGIHFAMDFLTQQNRRIAGLPVPDEQEISAKGKRVVVIGGGDTGSDCIGTSNRQGATQVVQIELLPKPPEGRPSSQPWPYYPMMMRTSSSQAEGCERMWSVLTKEFVGENGRVTALNAIKLDWQTSPQGRPSMQEIPGSEFVLEADLVLLAMGFLGPEADDLSSQLGLNLDQRGNVEADDNYMTSVPGVFAAGDMRRGQSLVVWAIAEGREAARGVDLYLMGETVLPTMNTRSLTLPRR